MQSRSELQEALNRLSDEQLQQVIAVVNDILDNSSDPVHERLRQIPGVRMPAHWRSPFEPVEPLRAVGELASERLIRERR